MFHKIVDFVSYNELDSLVISHIDCKFLEDFGPWKKDHQADSLLVNYEDGFIEEIDKEGILIKKCKIKLVEETDAK